MKFLVSLLFIFSTLSQISAQQTIGLSFNSEVAQNGYTLFPTRSNMVYLIDNCGYEINAWEVSERGYGPAKLTTDGDMYKLLRHPDITFGNGGGGAGLIERYSWDGILEWSFSYSSDTFLSHHDFTILDNGNLLILSWLLKSRDEAEQAGLSNPPTEGIWSETILEIKPLANNAFEIVWQWDAFDHIVQDINPALNNFGPLEENPQLLGINELPENGADLFHFNSIDYNENLDQILLSCRNCSEIYIIDHSTTTEEAATHEGGNAGKGGDILYRWGNIKNYLPQSVELKKLYGQHSAKWVKDHPATLGNIVAFNNGAGVPTGEFFSSIIEIEPSLDNFNYGLLDDQFLPQNFEWEYIADPKESFFSSRISSVQRLANGNTFINDGGKGIFFEVDADGETVWKYTNPISEFGPVMQGLSNTSGDVFSIQKYPSDSPVFNGQDLTPKDPLEINPIDYDCTLSSSLELIEGGFSYQNPVSNKLRIWGPEDLNVDYFIYSIEGILIGNGQFKSSTEIDASSWANGIYVLRIENQTFKLLKH